MDKCKISPRGWLKLQIASCGIKMNSKLFKVCQKKISLWSQIPLKNLTDSVKCHINANKIMTNVTLNKKIYKYIKPKKKLKKLFYFLLKKEKKGVAATTFLLFF